MKQADIAGALTRHVVEKGSTETQRFEWGEITWMDNAEITGSETLTLGVVQINSGKGNPEHHHPNCDEILYVTEGALMHTLDDREYTLGGGDMIHIPRGVRHRAFNSGPADCRMMVVYNTGRREVVGEFGPPR